MKKFLQALLSAVALMALTLPGSAAAGETLDRVMKTGKLVNALDAEYPPFSFLNAQNEMDGFDVDVAKEVAKRLGVKLETVTPSWELITAGHWNARWDICVGSMTPTKARGEVLDFPVLYYFAPSTMVVHKSNTTIHKPEDLTGKRVGIQAATTYESYLNHNLVIDAIGAPPVDYRTKDVVAVPYESEPLAFEDLALGDGVRLDAMITGLLTVSDQIKEGRPFKTVGPRLFQEPIAVATDKGDPEFEAKIKQIIEDMHKDGTLKRLSMARIGADITTP